MRECDLNQMDDCTVAKTKLRDLIEFENSFDKRIINSAYDVTLGGPNPCSCRPIIQALIEGYVPPQGSDNVQIPKIGDVRIDNGVLYFCMNVQIKPRLERSNQRSRCRNWVVRVRWETYSREQERRQPQLQDGTPVSNVNQIDDSQAMVRLRSGSQEVPVEFAQYFGVYDYAGMPKTCDFKENRYVCQPLKRAEVGESLPVMNSAGVRFDPGLTKDDGQEKIVIVKAYSSIQGNFINQVRNRINCDSFFIVEFRNGLPMYGRLVEPFTARISDIAVSDNYLPNGSQFREVSIEISLRDNFVETRDEFGDLVLSENFGWDDLVPNRGLSHLIYPGEDDFNGGTWPNEPVMWLGAAGQAPIVVGGQQVTEPQWLDCNGLPFINNTVLPPETIDPDTCSVGVNPDNILYLRYRKYKTMAFASSNLPNFLGNVFFYADPAKPIAGQLPPAHFPGAQSGDYTGTVLAPYTDIVGCES